MKENCNPLTGCGHHNIMFMPFPDGDASISVPVNSVIPVISGIEIEESTLTGTNGTWSGTPTSYTYQWYRDGVVIGGATAITYDLVFADVGTEITFGVIAANAGGDGTEAVSLPTGEIVALTRLSQINTFLTTSYDMSVVTGLKTNVAGSSPVTADKDFVYSLAEVNGGTLLPFAWFGSGGNVNTPIPNHRISGGPYWDEFYEGVYFSNNLKQQFSLTSNMSSSYTAFSVVLVYRWFPGPPGEGINAATSMPQIYQTTVAFDGANSRTPPLGFNGLTVGVGGGEVKEFPNQVGYPQGSGNNAALGQLMVDIYQKNGTSHEYYRNGILLYAWTTVADNSINRLTIGTNGHTLPRYVSYQGHKLGGVLTGGGVAVGDPGTGEIAQITAIVDDWNPIGEYTTGMPYPRITGHTYSDSLEQFQFAWRVENYTVPHSLQWQMFGYGASSGNDLDNTFLRTGSAATGTISNNIAQTGVITINHEDLDFNGFDIELSYTVATNLFTVLVNPKPETLAVGNDRVLYGTYPTGMARQNYFIRTLTGTGSAGTTFKLATTNSDGTIVVFTGGDIAGGIKMICDANRYLNMGLKAIRTSDGQESVETQLEGAGNVQNNVD